MKNKIVVTTICLVLLWAPVLASGGGKRADNSSIVGSWSCTMYGVKSVALKIREEKNGLSGDVLFYLIRHNDGKPARSSPGTPEPLIEPRFDGEVLRFKVSHRNAHPPQTLNDPPVSFVFELVKPNSAKLTREGGEPDSSCQLTRDQ
ncbi:MAG TPA: hypothetical protein VF532_22065 [Candidatus Angelobacter sp.]